MGLFCNFNLLHCMLHPSVRSQACEVLGIYRECGNTLLDIPQAITWVVPCVTH